jgi:Ca-activated chloride channel family protein
MALIGLGIALLLLIVRAVGRNRRQAAVWVSSVGLVRSALQEGAGWRRRIPAALLIAALLTATLATARPQASQQVAGNRTTILFAMDVSSSMCATDVAPNRLIAAQEAATKFIDDQPQGTTIGLVVFAGTAGVLVPPTTQKSTLLEAVDSLTTSRGTAIGQAILVALDAIAEIDPAVPSTGVEVPAGTEVQLAADAIVLLTDGANSQGVDPETAAQEAAARGVPVYPIGFGTDEPGQSVCDPTQIDTERGGFGGRGRGADRHQVIDEEALQQVADTTEGKYFRAENADQLQAALAELPSSFVTVRETVELAGWFAALAALLAASAIGLTWWWNRPRVTATSGSSN